DPGQQLVEFGRVGGPVRHRERERDILGKGQMVEKLAVLMHDTDPAAEPGDVVAAHPRDGLAEDRDSPGDRRKLAVAELQEGRFARPRWACEEVKRARRQRQCHVGQKPPSAIAMRHVLKLDQRPAPFSVMANMPWPAPDFSVPATNAWTESL